MSGEQPVPRAAAPLAARLAQRLAQRPWTQPVWRARGAAGVTSHDVAEVMSSETAGALTGGWRGP